MTTRMIQPGELGFDFSFSKPPPDAIIRAGGTFVMGYSSNPPANPDKNCTNPQDYIDAGLAYVDIWETFNTRSLQGFSAGVVDGLAHAAQAEQKGVPAGVPIVATSDTNTAPTNVNAQKAYMTGYLRNNTPYQYGGYMDTDLGAAMYGDWTLGVLPNAWFWSNPIRQLPGESNADYAARGRAGAELKATALGYHLFQHKGYALERRWNVDPNICVRPFLAWGNPREETNMRARDLPTLTNTPDSTHYPVGTKWAYDGMTKRRMTAEYGAFYGSFPGGVNPDETTLTDDQLAAIPDYAPTNGGSGPRSVTFQGTGVVE